MINYLTTVQTHIKSIDDINLTYISYRGTNTNGEEGEKFSALRNVSSFSMLTDVNIKIITAETILATEIARNNKTAATDTPKISIYACAYQLNDDKNIYITLQIADTIEEATVLFEDQMKNTANVKNYLIFKFGIMYNTPYIQTILGSDNTFSISVEERKHSAVIISDKLDSMAEYNRKIYSCTING
jgi:hypothetical protein